MLGNADTSLQEIVIAGGYPEAVGRSPGKRRDAWFAAYVSALLQRDVRDLANIEGLTDMPRLLSLLAGRVGGLLNRSELSRSTGIAHTCPYRKLYPRTDSWRPNSTEKDSIMESSGEKQAKRRLTEFSRVRAYTPVLEQASLLSEGWEMA